MVLGNQNKIRVIDNRNLKPKKMLIIHNDYS